MAKKNEKQVEETVILEDSILDASELNAGLRVTAQDILKAKDERKKEIDQQRQDRADNPNKINKLKIMSGTPYGLLMLHEFDLGIELMVHQWRGENQPMNEICQVHYGEECTVCKADPKNSYAISAKCFIVRVLNDVDATFDKTDRQGTVKTYKKRPKKILLLPMGKNNANMTAMAEAHRRKYFTGDTIWLIERETGKGFLPPATMTLEQFRERVGKEANLEVPEEDLAISKLQKVEILKLVLGSFDDVQWEKLGFKPPTAKIDAIGAPKGPSARGENSVRDSF